MPSIYEQIGGGPAVAAATEGFFDRLVADADLAPYFAGTDLDRHRLRVRSFLSAALGGPGLYRGPDMRTAHAGLGITPSVFDRVAGHLVATLHDLEVPQALVDQIAGVVLPLRTQIVERAAA